MDAGLIAALVTGVPALGASLTALIRQVVTDWQLHAHMQAHATFTAAAASKPAGPAPTAAVAAADMAAILQDIQRVLGAAPQVQGVADAKVLVDRAVSALGNK